MPPKSTLAIAAIWVFMIWLVIDPAANEPPGLVPLLTNLPPLTIATIILLPALGIGVAVAGMRHSPFYHPKLAQAIDSRFGVKAFESFLVRLRPILMCALAGVLYSVVGSWRSYRSGAPLAGYVLPAFFLSAALAFGVAHIVLYRRKAIGVHFGQEAVEPRSTVAGKIALAAALRSHRWTLIGVALLPSVHAVGMELFGVPGDLLGLPVVAYLFLAVRPWYSGRAPYSLVLVVGALLLVGGVIAFTVLALIRVFIN